MNQCEIPCAEKRLGECLQDVGIFEYQYDARNRVLYLPESIAKHYGWEREYADMPYGFAKQCVARQFREEFCQMYEAIRSGQHAGSCDFQVKGTDIWLRNKICRIEGTRDAVGFLQDISRDYQKTQRASKRFITSVQNLYDAIYEAELYSNSIRAWKEKDDPNDICKYDSFQHYLQVAWWDLVHPEHRERVRDMQDVEYVKGLFTDGKTEARFIVPRLTQEGVYKWFQTRMQLVEHTNQVMRIMIYRKDVDKELKEEEANKQVLRDALALAEQANNAKTDFLSRMSHDIRTPMNAIIGMTTIATANLEDRDRVKDCLAQISTSSRFLLGLVNDILDLSKIENGKMSLVNNTFSLYRMVDALTVTQVVAREKQQTFGVSIAPDVEEFYVGDEMRIQQVIMNLLNNASKYTPAGGKYTLRVSTGRKTNNHCILRFVVEDNGEGIRADFLEKMFEPFTQAANPNRHKGSGLGLAIAQNLVHLMNGTLSVQSEYGIGSCFTVEIPLEMVENYVGESWQEHQIHALVADDAVPVSAQKCSGEKGKISFHGERVLLVEDNELNQEVAKTLLEMNNLQVEVASGGIPGLEMFLGSQAGYYLAVLMDIQMPDMDGFETTQCIRRSDHPDAKTIPIYAMTANAFSSDVMAAKTSGMNGHIPKPVDFNMVSQILMDIIDGKK